MSTDPDSIRERLTAKGTELDIEKIAELVPLKARIEQKQGKVFVTRINMTDADKETGDYGDVYWRIWNVREVNEIYASQVYQDMGISAAKGRAMSQKQNQELFELKCDMVSRALCKPTTMSRQELILLEDYRFVEIMFNLIAKKSGLSNHLFKDMERFFLDNRGS